MSKSNLPGQKSNSPRQLYNNSQLSKNTSENKLEKIENYSRNIKNLPFKAHTGIKIDKRKINLKLRKMDERRIKQKRNIKLK
mmetsp:Transcript_23348/g.20736  ORF Transcript_23348/g.20736 Transcript_23348/m.20736 type:complete len:82 (+) Transcript_23348:30-275(+)